MNDETLRATRLQDVLTAASPTAHSWSASTAAETNCNDLARPSAAAGELGPHDRALILDLSRLHHVAGVEVDVDPHGERGDHDALG